MSYPGRVSLELPASPGAIAVGAQLVRTFCESQGMPERECQRLELAADEICTNVVTHAYHSDESCMYRVECELDGDVVVVRVIDHGASFNPAAVPVPDTVCPLEQRKIGGLGLFLVKKVTDSFEVTRTSTGENVACFRKRLPLPEAAEA